MTDSIRERRPLRSIIHIIGCGGMGSRIGEGVARMSRAWMRPPEIHLHDHDTYALHNVINQYVDLSEVGTKKPAALREHLLQINPDLTVFAHEIEVTDVTGIKGVVFHCVDSMQPRAEHVAGFERNADVTCVIETRMNSGVGISHCFDPYIPKHCDCWWLYWHGDDEADDMAGCGSGSPVISAVYGTAMLALRQFEMVVKSGWGQVPNRVYLDFEDFHVSTEYWPTT